MKTVLNKYQKKDIVVDTRSSWIYIGKLEQVVDNCILLSKVDVHDAKDTTTSKERYVVNSVKTGVKANRNKVYINLEYIVSFSPLEEIIHF